MQSKPSLLVIVFILALFFVLSFLVPGEVKQQSLTDDDTSPNVDVISVKRSFKDGVHMLNGSIQLPTPCHSLSYDVVSSKLRPEEVNINFKSKSESEFCVQVITNELFNIKIFANKDVTFNVTFNDRSIVLDIADVLESDGVNAINSKNTSTSSEPFTE